MPLSDLPDRPADPWQCLQHALSLAATLQTAQLSCFSINTVRHVVCSNGGGSCRRNGDSLGRAPRRLCAARRCQRPWLRPVPAIPGSGLRAAGGAQWGEPAVPQAQGLVLQMLLRQRQRRLLWWPWSSAGQSQSSGRLHCPRPQPQPQWRTWGCGPPALKFINISADLRWTTSICMPPAAAAGGSRQPAGRASRETGS